MEVAALRQFIRMSWKTKRKNHTQPGDKKEDNIWILLSVYNMQSSEMTFSPTPCLIENVLQDVG